MSYTRRKLLKTADAVLRAAAGERIVSGLSSGGSEADAAQPVPVYEVYALKYAGPVTSSLAMLLWNEGWNETIERNYYIWVIKGKNENIIVDTGTVRLNIIINESTIEVGIDSDVGFINLQL